MRRAGSGAIYGPSKNGFVHEDGQKRNTGLVRRCGTALAILGRERSCLPLTSTVYIVMADIELTRSHSKGIDGGRDAVEEVAQELGDKLGVQYEWKDDCTLVFEGQGAEGQIDVQEDAVRFLVELSAFLRPMKDTLKREAEDYLDQHLQS